MHPNQSNRLWYYLQKLSTSATTQRIQQSLEVISNPGNFNLDRLVNAGKSFAVDIESMLEQNKTLQQAPKILRKMEFTEPATAHRRYIYWVARPWLVREHARTIDEPSSMAPRWLALPILNCELLTIHLTDGTWLALREPQPSHPVAGLAVE